MEIVLDAVSMNNQIRTLNIMKRALYLVIGQFFLKEFRLTLVSLCWKLEATMD